MGVKQNTTEEQRTIQQNKALHVFFNLLAKELNDAGYDMKKTLKQEVEIPWTEYNVKEFLWRPMQSAVLGKSSTTELTKKEIDEVYEPLMRHLGSKLCVFVEFPSEKGKDGR